MKRIVAISNSDFARYAQRLIISLRNTNPDSTVTLYCDDREVFKILARIGGCEIIELPSIKTLGIKRAKFEAYDDAIRKGDFLYLDADIVVLDDLSELFGGDKIRACFDDLSACAFIEDKNHPWTGDPALNNTVYINSGVFYAPRRRESFFRNLYEQSLHDSVWQCYTMQDRLYDNHFLCAFLNMMKEEVELCDEEVFNWQGFFKNGSLMVERTGDLLINRMNRKKLKVVHFAGVRDMDSLLMNLPLAVSSLIMSRCLDRDFPFHENDLFRYMAAQSDHFREAIDDDFPAKVFRTLLRELHDISDNNFKKRYASLDSYVTDRESLLSIAYTKPNSHNRWNHRNCDGTYLEAQEYVCLRNVVSKYDIKTAIEAGAGETSLLFRDMNVKTLSIESTEGPWLDKALESGCNAHHVPFSNAEPLFDEERLERVLLSFPRNVDLIFIDSPVGTYRRSKILSQLLRLVGTKFVLFHDALRDSKNIYAYQLRHGLRAVEFFDTARGMILFEVGAEADGTKQRSSALDISTIITSPDYSLTLNAQACRLAKGATYFFQVALRNTGKKDIYSSGYRNPVFLSYHWLDEKCAVVHDGVRTPLPCDIHPGDCVEFEMEILTPDRLGRYHLEIDLVQELVSWFKDKNACLGTRILFEIIE